MQTISFRQLGTIIATIALALAILSIPFAVHSQRIASLSKPTKPDTVVTLPHFPSLIEHGLTETGDMAFGFQVID